MGWAGPCWWVSSLLIECWDHSTCRDCHTQQHHSIRLALMGHGTWGKRSHQDGRPPEWGATWIKSAWLFQVLKWIELTLRVKLIPISRYKLDGVLSWDSHQRSSPPYLWNIRRKGIRISKTGSLIKDGGAWWWSLTPRLLTYIWTWTQCDSVCRLCYILFSWIIASES